MSGLIPDIVRCCSQEVNSSERNFKSMFAQGLRIILENQFVRICAVDGFPQLVYKVNRGTGMGSLLSGDCSDLCFYKLCERPFALSPAHRNRYGVFTYGRFKDDGLVVFSHCDVARQDAFFVSCRLAQVHTNWS